ncbi:MAG: LacI family DNA-binding transcriptional regulator [Christensenellales bacterium]
MKKVSMQNIADKLGITKTLVHMALSNKYGVSEVTKSLIITTAIDMGYDFNRIRTTNTTKKRTRVTLLLMQWDLKANTFWNEIVCAVEQRCDQLNFDLNIKIWNEGNIENQIFSSVFDDKTQGIIALNHFPIEIVAQCKKMNIQTVLIDSSKYFGCEYNQVRINNYDGGFRAAEYLYGHGHRKILFIGFADYALSLKERYRGFKDFTRKHESVKCRFITDKAEDLMKLYDTEKLITNYKEMLPTAIMCINDAVTKHVYADLKKNNIRIGTDVSVMSFDCSVETEYLSPKLTGIYFDKQHLGTEAVNLLKESLDKQDSIPKTILLPTSLRERESVITV